MKLSLARLFKKEKRAPVAPSAPPPPIEKPASERHGKTVMPNMARTMEPAPIAAAAPFPSGLRLDSLGESRVSFPVPKAVPPELSQAPGERTVALQLAELLPQIPRELLGQAEVDPECRVSFNATELERGMANGRPAVLLRSIYQQAPTIFATEVPADDPREVALPFQQVLQQFASLQPRDDQERDEPIPEIETALSKVTLEDNKRFGSVAIPAAPRVKTLAPVSLPTSVPASQAKLPTPIRLPAPVENSAPAAAPPSLPPTKPEQLPKLPSLKVRFSPNGTGVPATERVPASSGSPVPTPLPSPFAPPPPARIPFKITPPASDLCPPPVLPEKTVDPAKEAEPFAFSTGGPRLRLPLRAVLRGLLPFQFTGSIEEVPESAVVEMPFAIVQPQLALGRIAISPAQFAAAMPEEFRSLFKVDEGGIPVPLPLPEVLQNLPNETLKLRGDQEEAVVAQVFETPFSQKAAEDAARMNVPAGPIAKAEVALQEDALAAGVDFDDAQSSGSEQVATPAQTAPSAAAERTPLQVALDTDDEGLDAKAVVAHASRLPGVSACAIVFSDGLSLAGNIPTEYEADALCGIAPEIMKRIADQMISAHFGALQGLTLFCAKKPVSFFAHGNICLAALHSAGELAAEIRERLGRITQELARIYAQPA